MKRKRKIEAEKPWMHMIEADSIRGDSHLRQLQEAQKGYVGVFVNDLYQVTYRDVESLLFSDPGDPPKIIAWLAIRRRDSAPVHDWRHFQLIKNDLVGEEREAIEIYPAESRLVDTCNNYHLWVFPAGVQIPFGYVERDISDITIGMNKQRPFVEPPSDLNAKLVDENDPETMRTSVRGINGH